MKKLRGITFKNIFLNKEILLIYIVSTLGYPLKHVIALLTASEVHVIHTLLSMKKKFTNFF